MNRRKRTLTIVLLLLLLIVPPLWITYREYRQARLDYALIEAIRADDEKQALKALSEGANGESRDHWEPPMFREKLYQLLNRFKQRTTTTADEHLPALLMLYEQFPRMIRTSTGAVVVKGTLRFSQPKPSIIRALLEHGANVNDRDEDGQSALSYAVCFHEYDVVRLLLESGSDPNLADVNGWTPLMFAVMREDANSAELLLQHGAKIDTEDNYRATALMYAAWERNVDICHLLLAHGAKVGVKDSHGETVLDITRDGLSFLPSNSKACQIIALLHSYGAK